MGTSTRYTTRHWWLGVRNRLTDWVRDPDRGDLTDAAAAYLRVLKGGGGGWAAVPQQRAALAEAAPRLCETLADLDPVIDATRRRAPHAALDKPDHMAEWFADTFAARICGDALVPDTLIRRAAMRTADRVLADAPEIKRALSTPAARGGGIDDALFCTLYKLFFGDVVAELLLTATIESMCLGIPGVSALLHFDAIAKPIHKLLGAILPNPCATAETQPGPLRRPIHRIASELTEETLTTVFGPVAEGVAA